jgi:uroporphyrin-III C-methyltransferase/precorrin-2 dehydrogenase/sirohydrochlorin ferrochelatase
MWLVVTATDDAVVQQAVFDAGTARRIWVNAADDPTRCSFILPAVHRNGSVIVAVSTSGSSPALAGWLRTRLAAALPSRINEIAQSLAGRRAQMRARGESTESFDWRPIIEQLVKETDAPHAEPAKREITP